MSLKWEMKAYEKDREKFHRDYFIGYPQLRECRAITMIHVSILWFFVSYSVYSRILYVTIVVFPFHLSTISSVPVTNYHFCMFLSIYLHMPMHCAELFSFYAVQMCIYNFFYFSCFPSTFTFKSSLLTFFFLTLYIHNLFTPCFLHTPPFSFFRECRHFSFDLPTF